MPTTHTRMTPWVGRLLGVNAFAFLVLGTVLTSPAIAESLQFQTADLATRPWTLLTYPLVHAGLLHLAATSLVIWVCGPPVERRLGGPGFVLYVLYCSLGAALFGLLISTVYPIPPLTGSTAAALGLAVACAGGTPDREFTLPPLPYPVRARTLVAGLVAVMGVLALIVWDPVFQIANLGGAGAGSAFLRLRALANQPAVPRPEPARRVALAPLRLHAEPPSATATAEGPHDEPSPMRSHPAHPRIDPARDLPPQEAAEDNVNRVLDKISQSGLDSLTAQERLFLDEVSRRKRQSP